MRIIRETSGRAREDAGLAVEAYIGCAHGCRYCFAKRNYKQSIPFSKPRPIPGFLRDFTDDCKLLSALHSASTIHMSFMCDPIPPIESEHNLTAKAIDVAHRFGQKAWVRSKAPHESCRPILERMRAGDIFSATLTTTSESARKFWEPNAGSTEDRIASLCLAKKMGITAEAVLEPILFPVETYEMIMEMWKLGIRVRVGKLNVAYGDDPAAISRERGIDWDREAAYIAGLKKSLGASDSEFYIKEDLMKYLPERTGQGMLF